jgi:hypothetical protein
VVAVGAVGAVPGEIGEKHDVLLVMWGDITLRRL